jgi:hypothetical protein
MLDGPWHHDIPRSLPPRWDDGIPSTIRTVYLDQWCFNHLADDRAGKPRRPDEAGCFEFFRGLALAGKVAFVLSRTHYLENGVRAAVDARWRTAVTMAELTGFNSITAAGLLEWDAMVAVGASAKHDAAIPSPTVFGRGLHHCFFGRDNTVGTTDHRANEKSLWDYFSPGVRALLPGLEEQLIVEGELAQLALWHPVLWPDTTSMPTLPRDVMGDRLIAEAAADEAAFSVHQDEYPRTPALVRAVMEARFLVSPEWQYVLDACARLGVSAQVLLAGLGREPDGDARAVKRNRKALQAFLASMPVQGRFTELRVQSHLEHGRKRRSSDALDYFQLASVSPFVDYLVADAYMADQARKAGFASRPGAAILSSLADLRQRLEAGEAASTQVR